MVQNLAASAPLNTDATANVPAPQVNFRGQHADSNEVGLGVNINPANNTTVVPTTTVVVATVSAKTLASDFENGDVIDGVTLSTGDKVLVKNQASAAENGVYTVASSGAPARSTGWTTADKLTARAQSVKVSGGTSAGKTFVQSNNVSRSDLVVNTTALTFVEDQTQLTHQRDIFADVAPSLVGSTPGHRPRARIPGRTAGSSRSTTTCWKTSTPRCP